MFRFVILAVAIASPTLVCAQTPEDVVTKSRHVQYVDLDLRTEAGRAALQRRVNIAVNQVCDENEAGADFGVRARWLKKCRADARASAQTQILSALRKASTSQLALAGR